MTGQNADPLDWQQQDPFGGKAAARERDMTPARRMFLAGVPPEEISKQLKLGRFTVALDISRLPAVERLAGLDQQLRQMIEPKGPGK